MRTNDVTLFMVAANFYTVAYVAVGVIVVNTLSRGLLTGLALAFAWIYLVPPLICRAVLLAFGRPSGPATPRSRSYRVWWLLLQLQIVFNRVPQLEELLRMVPGVYGFWLNLWGSKVSLMAYWSPGVLVTDRYLLRVGRGAVLGAGCMVGGHLVSRDAAGEYTLTVSEVTVEEGAIVGAHALIAPGCHIGAREVVPAGRSLGPFTRWKQGKRSTMRRDRAATEA
jgi:hypothetical protein